MRQERRFVIESNDGHTEQPRRDALVLFGRFHDRFRQRQRVTDHGAVQSVFRHYCGPSPALFGFAPLGPSVLEPDLF